MIRRKGPILAAGVIAAFALGWYRGLFGVWQDAPPASSPVGTQTAQPQSGQSSERNAPSVEQARASASPTKPVEQSPPSEPARESVAMQQATPDADPADGAAPQVSDAARTAPGFDVVRVEPDGSTVVAGKGAANERIALTDGNQTLGEAQTDANGDFVMTLSLPTGSHRLQLAQRDDVLSDDAAVVNVPPPGRPDQLLVMMQRPGEASEVLQKPAEPSVAASPGVPPSAAPAATTVPSEPEPRVAAVAPALAEPPREEVLARAELSVEAVEIEGDRLYVAGSAKSGSAVRIYLDDQPVVETRSGAGDRFIATARTNVPVGDHTVRADVVDAGGRVIARVEVPFQRPEGSSMAAIAAAPQTETAPPASSPQAEVASVPVPDADTQRAQSEAAPTTPEAAGSESASPNAARAEGSSGAIVATAPAEPQTVRQAPLQASASRVIIRRGDTLWRISRDTYGRGSRYTVIYLANGDQIRDPDRIYPGQVFRVPDTGEADAPRG